LLNLRRLLLYGGALGAVAVLSVFSPKSIAVAESGHATVTAVSICSAAALSPPTPTQAAGTIVGLTASSTGCPSPQYAFYVQYPGGTWYLKQGFGGPTFNWDTTGLAPGVYVVHAWASAAGAGHDSIGSATVTLTGCTASGANSDVGSPQVIGATVTFTATNTGCTSPVYEFWLMYPNGTWVMERAFNATPTWAWDTHGFPAGTYTIHVWANESGSDLSAFEAYGGPSYTLTPPVPCATATLSPSTPSQAAGTTVNLTASSTGCASPQYAFYVQYPDGTWYLKQGFGGATFNWDTTGVASGVYLVHAWASATGAGHDAIGSATVTLIGCATAALSPPTPTQDAGSVVAFIASSTGCLNPTYEFWVQYPGGAWY